MLQFQRNVYMTAALTAGVAGVSYYIYRTYNEHHSTKLPLSEEWKAVGTLKELNVFPIKSCGSLVLNSAECTILGLKNGWLRDRVLMVVDENNNFITSRVYGELFNVEPLVKSSILMLKHKDLNTVQVDLAKIAATQKSFTAVVWGINVPVYDCGKEVSEWFTRLLQSSAQKQQTFRLVYYASEHCRTIRHSKGIYYKLGKNDTGAFPDEASYHLINESSVNELNSRLQDYQANTDNFRPNFVVTGPSAYEEDKWNFVKIGDNIFKVLKPCLRCQVTTIDPETGVRKPQVLETLRSYRQIEEPEIRLAEGTAPRMGLMLTLCSASGGEISQNDTVYVA